MERKYLVKVAFKVVGIQFTVLGFISLLEYIFGHIVNIFYKLNYPLLSISLLPAVVSLIIGLPLLIVAFSVEKQAEGYSSYMTIKGDLKNVELITAGLMVIVFSISSMIYTGYNILSSYKGFKMYSDILEQMIISHIIQGAALTVQILIGVVLFRNRKSYEGRN